MTDQDEILSVESSTNHTDLLNVHNQEVTTPAFTLINCHPSRTVDQHQILWHTEFSEDPLYDCSEDRVQDEEVEKRERRRPQTVKGGSISVTPAWETEDKGGIGNVDQVYDHHPKDRRASCKKRSYYLGAQLITPPQAWDQEEHHPRPSTPIAPSYRSNNGSSAAKCKANLNPAFKNPLITKPSLRPGSKHIDEDETQQEDDSLIKYQGFITSQESAQPSSGRLAKTTMEKLTAFRCEPSSIKSKEAAKAWWISSGRPINEGSTKKRRVNVKTTPENSGLKLGVDNPDISQATGLGLRMELTPYSPTSNEFDEGLNDDDFLAIQVESDDDYPMDKSEEEELVQLAAMKAIANDIQVHEPPSSIQCSLDDEREVYDSSLQFSPTKSQASSGDPINKCSANNPPKILPGIEPPAGGEEDWSFISANSRAEDDHFVSSNQFSAPESQLVAPISPKCTPPKSTLRKDALANLPSSPGHRNLYFISNAHMCVTHVAKSSSILDDSHEYEPLEPFIRPPFPSLIMDRCPINGLSAQCFLRTCFRIGEMYQVGSKYNAEKLDAVIELFARVNFSSREPGTTKQHFQFMDLWHDRAPYPNGILESFRMTGLAESESSIFLLGNDKKMARVLGRMKRDVKNACWFLQIINIRVTDWEEIRWTKRIMSGDDIAKKFEAELVFEK